MIHYLITNREILKQNGKERIRTDGKEEASDELRFALFNSDKFDKKLKDDQLHTCIEVLPDLVAKKINTENFGGDNAGFANVYPANILEKNEDELSGSSRFFSHMYRQMTAAEGGDVLLFIHGFNTDLKTVLSNMRELEEKYIGDNSTVKHIVAFTWPAMDKILRYRNDARDAELSGFALGRAYSMLIDFFRIIFGSNPSKPKNEPCGNNIHLLCHSMGNRVLENMMIKLTREFSQITALFKEVILMSSDIDWNCFEEPRALYRLTEICERVHIYYHKKDAALLISETTKNAFNRLGKYGPRDTRKIPSHVYCVDCTDINDQKGLKSRAVNHWFYVDSVTVVEDVKKVLGGAHTEDLQKERRYVNAAQSRLTK